MTMYPRIDVFHVFSYLLGIGNCGRERPKERKRKRKSEGETVEARDGEST